MKDLRLSKDRTLRLRPGRQAREVLCRAGACWVTQEGDPDDHILRSGDALRLRRNGRVVVFGLEDAEILVRGGDGAAFPAACGPAPLRTTFG